MRVGVGVTVGIDVTVGVAVAVAVLVGVLVAVTVGVAVDVLVAMAVAVAVALALIVPVAVVATCRQQGRSLLPFLVAVGEAALQGTAAPSLLPAGQGDQTLTSRLISGGRWQSVNHKLVG